MIFIGNMRGGERKRGGESWGEIERESTPGLFRSGWWEAVKEIRHQTDLNPS